MRVCKRVISAASQSRRDQVRSTAKWQFGFIKGGTVLAAHLWSLWRVRLESSSSTNPSNFCELEAHWLSHWLSSLCSLLVGWWQIATFQMVQVFYLLDVSCLFHCGEGPHQHLLKRIGPSEKLATVITRPQWGSCMKFSRNY